MGGKRPSLPPPTLTLVSNYLHEPVRVWFIHVHRLSEDLCRHYDALVQCHVFYIVLLECGDGVHIVLSSGVGLPGGIVAGGIRAVELEPTGGVVTSVHKSDAEWSAAAVLSVGVLVVSKVLHNLLDVDRGLLAVSVSLACETGHIDEDVGISCDA